MWVRTQANELLNLDSIEYVVVALDEETERYELQAYTFGSMPAENEEGYYPLMSAEDSSDAEFALDRLARALGEGEALVDLRG